MKIIGKMYGISLFKSNIFCIVYLVAWAIVIDVVNIVHMYVHIGNCHREYGTN